MRNHCLRQPSGNLARSDVGKPLAYKGGSCKIGARPPQPSFIHEGSLVRTVSHEKLVGNLLLKIPYTLKKSYGGTPEPQTAQDAPWLHGPSLKTRWV